MSFLLDTNICSHHLRHPSGFIHRFIQHSGRLFVSTVSLAELFVWVYRRHDPRPGLIAIDTFKANEVQVLPFDEACAERFGQVRGTFLKQGVVFSTVDLMISSVALVHDLTLVTHNVADFAAVPDLRVEDWLAP